MIRAASVGDLAAMEVPARAFYGSSRHLKQFDIGRFVDVWTNLLRTNTGAIFLSEENSEIHGAIGGIVHPDIYGFDLVAEEFFWFIEPGQRGAGVKLYKIFEQWAKDRGAKQIQMVHLLDSMPEKVGRFYRAFGYEPIETRYGKAL